MTTDANILLLGLRGSGKSTVGRLLAESLGRRFHDTDDLAPAELGESTVADAWRAHGEAAFRRAEAATLERLLTQRNQIIALGGGTPTAPRAAELLQGAREAGSAITVYLRFPPAVLWKRLREAGGAGADRPSLTGADPLDEIDVVFSQRDPLYQSLADLVIDEDLPAGAVAEAIARRAEGW